MNIILAKANNIVKRSFWYNNVQFPDCRKFWDIKPTQFDVVNIGSTASLNAFNYSDISLECANLAMTSQFLLADFEILKYYSKFIKKGGTVILGMSLFPFDGYDVTYFDRRYYTILPSSSIWNYSAYELKQAEEIKEMPINYYPIIELYYSIKRMFCKKRRTFLSKEDYVNDAKRKMKDGWMKQFEITNLDKPMSQSNMSLADQMIEIMIRIRDLCKEQGFNFVMVMPPVSPSLKSWLTPSVRDNYIYVCKNSEMLNTVRYLDYLDDMDFDSFDNFENSYILNRKGSQLFTHKVLNDLNLL